MANVADYFSGLETSKPIFIVQAGNVEKFGLVTENTHKIINAAFGISIEDSIENNNEDKNKETKLNIYDLIKEKSNYLYFSENILIEFIEKFNNDFSKWNSELENIYDIEIRDDITPDLVPNPKEIGTWLENNKNTKSFAKPTSAIKSYNVEEYKVLPNKPSGGRGIGSTMRAMQNIMGEPEYKLETVTRHKSYIKIFEYTHEMDKRIIQVYFNPKLELVDPLSLYIVPIYSNKEIFIHYCYETLNRSDWNTFSSPKCETWRIVTLQNISSSSSLASDHVKSEVIRWLEEDFSKKIE